MAWILHEEFIDPQQSRHVVIFKNRDTGAEHQLIHRYKLPACPTCGHLHSTPTGAPIDFAQHKAEELAKLNAHHRKTLAYREQHAHVELRSERKK